MSVATRDVASVVLPTQMEFLLAVSGEMSTAGRVGFVGGVRSGKTHAGGRAARDSLLANPFVLGLIAANSYKQLAKSTCPAFESALDELGLRYRFDKQLSEYRVRVPWSGRYVTGTVLVRSMSNYNDLRGVELGWAWLDESRDMNRDIWSVVEGRLSDARMDRPVLFTTTTPNGFDWLYAALVDEVTAADADFYHVVHASTRDNQFVHRDFVGALTRSYDSDLAQQEIEGQFVNIGSGQLYSSFDRAVHVNEGARYVREMPLILALDQNPHPLCGVVLQDHVAETWAVREITIRHGTMEAVSDRMREWFSGHRAGIWIYGDALLGTASAQTGRSDWEILTMHLRKWYEGEIHDRIPSRHPGITNRVNAVNARLRDAEGRHRLFIAPNCVELRRDLEQVKAKDGVRHPDKTNKMRTHWSDAVGYYLAEEYPVDGWRADVDQLEALTR